MIFLLPPGIKGLIIAQHWCLDVAGLFSLLRKKKFSFEDSLSRSIKQITFCSISLFSQIECSQYVLKLYISLRIFSGVWKLSIIFFKCFFLIFFYFFFASFFIVSFSLVVFIVSSPLSNFITAILTFIKFISKDFREHLRRSTMYLFLPVPRGGSRTAATSKMEHFVIIVNGFQLNGLRAPSWMLQQS